MPEHGEIPLVYLDTSVWLQVINPDDPHQMADKLILAAADGRINLVASWLLRAEIQTSAGPNIEPSIVSAVDALLDNDGIRWVAVDRFVAAKALEVSRLTPRRLAGADAVHLATAVLEGADYLMVIDKGFPRGKTIEGVKVVAPTVVWQEDLFDSGTG